MQGSRTRFIDGLSHVKVHDSICKWAKVLGLDIALSQLKYRIDFALQKKVPYCVYDEGHSVPGGEEGEEASLDLGPTGPQIHWSTWQKTCCFWHYSRIDLNAGKRHSYVAPVLNTRLRVPSFICCAEHKSTLETNRLCFIRSTLYAVLRTYFVHTSISIAHMKPFAGPQSIKNNQTLRSLHAFLISSYHTRGPVHTA